MAEPTLSLTWDGIRNEVYEYLFGGNDEGYTNESDTDRKRLVERTCESGLRQFYNPPPVEGRTHDWSFLMPVATLSLNAAYSTGTIAATNGVVTLSGGTWPAWAAAGEINISVTNYAVDTRDTTTHLTLVDTSSASDAASSTSYSLHQDDYDLPDDFGNIMGVMTYAQADNAIQPVEMVGEGRMRELRQRDYNVTYSSEDPFYGAIRPKARSHTLEGTRYEIMFWPDVTAAATLSYRYRVLPDKPETGSPSAGERVHGITQHSETILYSCLAEAERRMDGERGIMYQTFQEYLVTSVTRDRQDNKAEVYGYNADWSDRREMYGPRRLTLFSSGVTYKGQGT